MATMIWMTVPVEVVKAKDMVQLPDGSVWIVRRKRMLTLDLMRMTSAGKLDEMSWVCETVGLRHSLEGRVY